jgi:hypothetical protein
MVKVEMVLEAGCHPIPTYDEAPVRIRSVRADDTFVSTDASSDFAFVDSRDGKAILILDAQLDGSSTVDTGSNAALDALCDLDSLWTAIEIRFGTGFPLDCIPTQNDGNSVGVIFDSQGRVVDDTEYVGGDKQTWLDSLANRRWPCAAGQTIPYRCGLAD